MITSTFPLFSKKVQCYLTLGLLIPFISTDYTKFCAIEAEMLDNSLTVSIRMGNTVVCSKVHCGCPISFEGRLMPDIRKCFSFY